MSTVSTVAWGSWWLRTATYGAIAVLLSGIIFIVVLFLSLTSVMWLWAAENPDASFARWH